MHLLSGGRLAMLRSIYEPAAPAGEWLQMPVSCALFLHPQGAALFDTGCHPEAADNAAERWGARRAAYLRAAFLPEETVVGQLGRAGLTPDDVDLVVCSHLHFDHCGCNAFFRRATVICQARELEAARADQAGQQGFLAGEWDVGLPIRAIDGEHDVFGDGRLTLIPLPGHTPGSMGAHAVLDRSGPFLLASDAAPLASTLAQRVAPRGTLDPDGFLSSLEAIARFRADGAEVVFGHDAEQWRAVRKGDQAYD